LTRVSQRSRKIILEESLKKGDGKDALAVKGVRRTHGGKPKSATKINEQNQGEKLGKTMERARPPSGGWQF